MGISDTVFSPFQYISKVLHPGLPSHPQHEVAKKQQYGHSGMISFYHKGGLEESKKFLKALKLVRQQKHNTTVLVS